MSCNCSFSRVWPTSELVSWTGDAKSVTPTGSKVAGSRRCASLAHALDSNRVCRVVRYSRDRTVSYLIMYDARHHLHSKALAHNMQGRLYAKTSSKLLIDSKQARGCLPNLLSLSADVVQWAKEFIRYPIRTYALRIVLGTCIQRFAQEVAPEVGNSHGERVCNRSGNIPVH